MIRWDPLNSYCLIVIVLNVRLFIVGPLPCPEDFYTPTHLGPQTTLVVTGKVNYRIADLDINMQELILVVLNWLAIKRGGGLMLLE